MHSTGAQTDPLLKELIPEISVLHCGFLQILKWQTATGTGVWIILRVRGSCDFMAKKKNALSHTKWIIRESLSTITMLPFIIMVQITRNVLPMCCVI